MAKKKITCLGGGSLYFPRALGDLVLQEDLAGSEIVLYDIDAEKAGRMAALGRRFSDEAGHGLRVRAADELADTLDGADFAISSIGGSGAEITPSVYGSYYHAADMHIAAKHGIFQVIGDTCGPAGMMMGLRSVRAYIDLCREMERRCPDVVLFSHSNPMAVLCRAMNKYTDVQVVGVCHGVQATIGRCAELLNVPAGELDCVWVGTNHYYWVLKAAHRGEDLTERLLAAVTKVQEDEVDDLWRHLSAAYGYTVGIPSANHLIEFYPWATRVKRLDDLPYDLPACARRHGFDDSDPMPVRREPTPELREEFLTEYQGILDGCALPEPGGSDWASEEGVARMISAIAHGRREVFIVNTPNGGLIPNLPATALVEVEGVTDSTGVRGIAVGECPPALKGMLEKRFAWQELVVDAAVTGDRQLALQAMLLDEMSLSPRQNEAMLDELLKASRDLLPQFFS